MQPAVLRVQEPRDALRVFESGALECVVQGTLWILALPNTRQGHKLVIRCT